MKRFLTLLLAMCLALALCGCRFITKSIIETDGTAAGTDVPADDSLLYDHGLELAGLLEEMLSSGEYFQLMTSSQEVSDIIMPLMRSDFSEPGSAYMIALSEDAIPLLMDAGDVDMDNFSAPLREFVERRVLNSVPTMLNARAGSSALAAASICTVSNTWVGETLEQDCYLLYFYPYACPIVVTFCGGDGFVQGSATLLLGDTVTEDSLDEVAGLFRELGAEGMHIKKLEINND